MSTVQLEGLWQYIQTLSLSRENRQWLADRLIMPSADVDYYESEKFYQDLDKAEEDIANGLGVQVTNMADLDALFV